MLSAKESLKIYGEIMRNAQNKQGYKVEISKFYPNEIIIFFEGSWVLGIEFYGLDNENIEDGLIFRCRSRFDLEPHGKYQFLYSQSPEDMKELIPIMRLAGASEKVINQVEEICPELNREKLVRKCNDILTKYMVGGIRTDYDITLYHNGSYCTISAWNRGHFAGNIIINEKGNAYPYLIGRNEINKKLKNQLLEITKRASHSRIDELIEFLK